MWIGRGTRGRREESREEDRKKVGGGRGKGGGNESDILPPFPLLHPFILPPGGINAIRERLSRPTQLLIEIVKIKMRRNFQVMHIDDDDEGRKKRERKSWTVVVGEIKVTKGKVV